MADAYTDDPTHQLRELVRAGRFQEALAWYRSAGEMVTTRAEAHLLAATAATRVGDFALGAVLADEALRRFTARGDFDGRMRALNLLGVIGFERGRLADAEEHLTEALNLAHRLEDGVAAARACNNLASVVHLRGRPDEAVGLYRGALLSYQRLGDRRGAAETYHNLGLTFRQLSEYDEAEKAVHQALRHAEFVGEPGLLALASAGRAELRIALGDSAFAYAELERAGRLAERAADVVGVAEVRRIRALAALRDGRHELARDEAEAARVVAQEHGVALLQAESSAVSALAHRALGELEVADRRRDEAVTGLRALGATALLERFEADWST